MRAPASLIDELEIRVKSGTNAQLTNIFCRVTDLFILNARGTSQAEIEVFDDVMMQLIEKIEDRILAELSQRLASIENSPVNVVHRLARHDQIAVAGPVLEKSDLSDVDLVEIAYTRSQAHLSAIAARSRINPVVADVLVRRGNSEVVMKVTANKGAAFSHSGFTDLVKRALDNVNLAEKVSGRDDIPPELYEFLVLRATEKVKRHLVATCKLEMRGRIERMLANASDHIAKEAPKSSSSDSAWSARTLIKRDLTKLRSQFDEAVALGDGDNIISSLAKLVGLSDETVKNVVRQGSEDGILIICKAGEISWQSVRQLLLSKLWAQQLSDADLKDISDRYFRFSSESAERVLLFMKARNAMSAAEMQKLFAEAGH
jgi:uncharacterized protein (DUF2336 family)